MKLLFRMALFGYWLFLTRALLTTTPWELLSRRLAENPPIDLAFEPTSWLVHLGAYFFLGLLIQLSVGKVNKWYWGLLGFALVHSVTCECLQRFIPGRWPNAWDVVANSLGLMFFLASGLRSQKNQKLLQWDHSLQTSPKKRAA